MSVATRTVLTLALVLLGWVAWRVLSLGMADHLASSAPARALAWRDGHPLALVELALHGEGLPQAAALARSALSANPLEGRAYRALGVLADAQGNRPLAASLYEAAVARAPRDLPSRLWLERHYLGSGQLLPALRQLDLSLRVEPGLRARQFPILAGLAALPSTRAAISATLASRPLWRPEFLEYLCQQGADSGAVDALLARLSAAPGGLAPRESATWIERLLRERRWNEAYLAWTSALDAEGRAALGRVFDGGFERESGNFGFDWRTAQAPGSAIERLATPGAIGKLALRVSFDETRLQSGQPRQLLLLSTGDFVLSGRARAEQLETRPGLAWELSCADTGQLLARSTPLSGTTPWQRFSTSFQVPGHECAAQWLALAVSARLPSEQLISGDAWFDELRIARSGPPAVAPVAQATGLVGAPLVAQAEGFVPLRQGQALFAGDLVLAPRSAAARLRFADGCTLPLGSASLLQVPSASPCAGARAAITTIAPARFGGAGGNRDAAALMASLSAALSGRQAEEASDDTVGP